jgi:hypothetical protein
MMWDTANKVPTIAEFAKDVKSKGGNHVIPLVVYDLPNRDCVQHWLRTGNTLLIVEGIKSTGHISMRLSSSLRLLGLKVCVGLW